MREEGRSCRTASGREPTSGWCPPEAPMRRTISCEGGWDGRREGREDGWVLKMGKAS